jgi:tripartite motif-containing protein 2/3
VRPSGIAVDADGRVFVSDAHRHAIYVFEADGRCTAHFGQEGLRALEFFKPSGLTLRNPGELMILDHGNHRGQIVRIGADGQGAFVHAFGARFFTQLIRQEAAERARQGSGG